MIRAGTEVRDGDGVLLGYVIKDVTITAGSFPAEAFWRPMGGHPEPGSVIDPRIECALWRLAGIL